MFTHMLLPTDGSELSERAVGKGIRLAKESNAKVTGISVAPKFHVLTFNTTMLEDTKEQFLADSRAQATKNLATLQKAAAEIGVPCDTVVEVSDDGAGLNLERILSKARAKGLVGQNDVLSEAEIANLIFLPGFSTADQATDVSGRGVGMDVVKRNIKELGGNVELRTESGRGSRFIINLPLTLAIVDGQSVAVGNEIYIVPLIAITYSDGSCFFCTT